MLHRNMSANSANISVSSLPSTPSLPLAYSYLLRIAFGIIALMGFVSNGLLCVVILKNRKMLRSAYNLLIFSLAVTDLLTGIILRFKLFCKARNKRNFHLSMVIQCTVL